MSANKQKGYCAQSSQWTVTYSEDRSSPVKLEEYV